MSQLCCFDHLCRKVCEVKLDNHLMKQVKKTKTKQKNGGSRNDLNNIII